MSRVNTIEARGNQGIHSGENISRYPLSGILKLVLVGARDIALTHRQEHIGTLYFLTSLIQNDEDARRVLRNSTEPVGRVTRTLEDITTSGGSNRQPRAINPKLTPYLRNLLGFAITKAVEHRDPYIGTKHVLFALCESRQTIGNIIIETLGANTKYIYTEALFLEH